MMSPKIRQTLITLHLWAAGLLAPAFLLVGFTGAMHIIGVGETVVKTDVSLSAGEEINLDSDTLEADVRAFIAKKGLAVDFEYLRMRSDGFQTRPTSRPFLSIQDTPGGQVAKLNTPNLQYSLMELHKGHGPRIFRTYQIVFGMALLFVIISGVSVGLMAANYRRATLIGLGAGSALFLVLGFLV